MTKIRKISSIEHGLNEVVKYLKEDDIKEVLTKLFLDCRDKIESCKESLRPDVGVNSFTGGKIENAERAIKSLSPSPSASTSPLAQSEAQTVIGR